MLLTGPGVYARGYHDAVIARAAYPNQGHAGEFVGIGRDENTPNALKLELLTGLPIK